MSEERLQDEASVLRIQRDLLREMGRVLELEIENQKQKQQIDRLRAANAELAARVKGLERHIECLKRLPGVRNVEEFYREDEP